MGVRNQHSRRQRQQDSLTQLDMYLNRCMHCTSCLCMTTCSKLCARLVMCSDAGHCRIPQRVALSQLHSAAPAFLAPLQTGHALRASCTLCSGASRSAARRAQLQPLPRRLRHPRGGADACGPHAGASVLHGPSLPYLFASITPPDQQLLRVRAVARWGSQGAHLHPALCALPIFSPGLSLRP